MWNIIQEYLSYFNSLLIKRLFNLRREFYNKIICELQRKYGTDRGKTNF